LTLLVEKVEGILASVLELSPEMLKKRTGRGGGGVADGRAEEGGDSDRAKKLADEMAKLGKLRRAGLDDEQKGSEKLKEALTAKFEKDI
jgi:hypothetical protein